LKQRKRERSIQSHGGIGDGGCHGSRYCGAECQRKAYKRQHKTECKAICAAKRSAGRSWSCRTHAVPQLPVHHAQYAQPNRAGAQLAEQAWEDGTTPAQVARFNPNLALWMQHVRDGGLTDAEIRRVSEMLLHPSFQYTFIVTNPVVMHTILLLGCNSAGQPGIAELFQIKLGAISKSRLRATRQECIRIILNNEDRDESERIFFPLQPNDHLLDPNRALKTLVVLTFGRDFPVDASIFGRPVAARLADDLRRVLVSAGLAHKVAITSNTTTTSVQSIEALMHATSFRILNEQGVPPELQSTRYTLNGTWEQDPQNNG